MLVTFSGLDVFILVVQCYEYISYLLEYQKTLTLRQKPLSKEERLNTIRTYVSLHQLPLSKQTKADVIRYMHTNYGSATDTTHTDIKELISSGELKIERVNNQMHYLIINDKSEFNMINNWLSTIETIIDSGEYKPSRRAFQKLNTRSFWLNDAIDTEFGIQFSYNTLIDIMLQVLLVKTDKIVQDQSSRQELFTRIIRLMLKAPSKNLDSKFTSNLTDYCMDVLSQFKEKILSHPKPTKGAKKKSDSHIKLANNLISCTNDFRKKFADGP